jgi:FMN phosphatase YigB (HAD superfamily)
MRSAIKDYKNIIFDYDGTISKIPINWSLVRKNFRNHAKLNYDYSFESGMRLDQMEYILIENFPKKSSEILNFRKNLELGFHNNHINNSFVVEFIKNTNNNLFIVSNNFYTTIKHNLENLCIYDKFTKIITCDTYNQIKPSVVSWTNLSSDYKLSCRDTILIGDNPLTDGVYAKKIGITYFQIITF